MSYTFFLRFTTSLSLQKTAALVLCDKEILHTQYSDCEMTVLSPDTSHAFTTLAFLRNVPEIENILVRDDEGWECEEIDLLTENGRDELAKIMTASLQGSPPGVMDASIEKASEDIHPAARLILASQSPRREELLGLLGIPFTARAADIDEDALTQVLRDRFKGEPFSIMAAMIVMNLAREKAKKLLLSNPDAVVIGSDTIVTIDTAILGKPSSPEAALDMLRLLSGRDHHVYTGVSIVSRQKEETFFTVTRVGFYPWSPMEEELARSYILEGSPLDKAGAYGIQDKGALFIRGIKGNYYTVVGFPVSEVYRRLQGFEIASLKSKGREN